MAGDAAKEKQIPLILILIGLALYVMRAFTSHGGASVPQVLAIVLVAAAIQTAVLIGAAFIVAALFSVSFGEVKSAILKFAGAALVAGGIASLIPFGGIVALFVFLGLIMWLFEIEIVYAIALAVAQWVIVVVVSLGVGAML